MDWWTGAWVVAATTAAGLLATGWHQIRGFLSRCYSRMVVTIEMSYPMDRAMRSYFNRQFRKSRFGVRFFSGFTAYVRSKRRWEMVPYETTGDDVSVYWRGLRPVWVHNEQEKEKERRLHLSFFRGTFTVDQLIFGATDHWNNIASGIGYLDWDHGHQRFQIIRVFGSGGQGERHTTRTVDKEDAKSRKSEELAVYEHKVLRYEMSDLGPEIHEGNALDLVAMSERVEEAVEEARRWLQSETWFRERGVPWRRGWLLYGKPGTGKTCLVRAIAEDLDLPIYVFDLATLSNRELVEEWEEMLEHSPCIALMEDIDSVFRGRRNLLGESGGGLTFDCLLNTIDGVERCDGLFTVITTNKLDSIDPAIAETHQGDESSDMPTRPGRVDRIIRMEALTVAGREKLAKRILADWPELVNDAVRAGDGDTGAQFQERCLRMAEVLFWAEETPAA